MLKRIRIICAYHLQAAVHSLNLLCRKPIATLMTSIVIAITLALPALFWIISDNLANLTTSWQKGGHISLYLKPGLSESAQQQVVQEVRKTNGVAQVNLKSADQGLAELTEQEGMQDIMRYLPENPLPAVLDVIPDLQLDSPAHWDLLARQLQTIAQVDAAKVDLEWISRLHALLGFVANFADSLLVLLAMAVVVIVGTTLRLAIHSRQEEIQVLKLIGAQDSFILRPFLYSGVWYGAIGALVAIFLVNIFILSLSAALNQLAVVYQMHYPLTGLSIRQVLLLVVFAIILGWMGARLSVKRQLASIEPQI